MSRGKTEISEIWERLSELDGAVRAIERVLLHQIFQSDAEHRHHADMLNVSLERDISSLPRVLPNEHMLAALEKLAGQIGNIAAGNHQRLDETDP